MLESISGSGNDFRFWMHRFGWHRTRPRTPPPDWGPVGGGAEGGQLDKWPPGTSSLHGWIAKRMICELQSKHGFTNEKLFIKANLAWVSSFLAPATSPETTQATVRENP
jgi:hypothetical protein